MAFVVNNLLGQIYPLDRDLETDKFQCPKCSHTTDGIRSIEKHGKDHERNSNLKHATRHYHPYANTTSDIIEHASNTGKASLVDTTNDVVNMMDVEGIF